MDNAEKKWDEWDAKSDECGIAPSEIRNAYKQALRKRIEKLRQYRKEGESAAERLSNYGINMTVDKILTLLDEVEPKQ